MLDQIINNAGIELIILVICIYYGVKMLITKSADVIWKTNKPKIKNEEEYAKKTGILIIVLGVLSVVAGLLRMFINPYAGIVIVIVVIIAFGFVWKKISDEHVIK